MTKQKALEKQLAKAVECVEQAMDIIDELEEECERVEDWRTRAELEDLYDMVRCCRGEIETFKLPQDERKTWM